MNLLSLQILSCLRRSEIINDRNKKKGRKVKTQLRQVICKVGEPPKSMEGNRFGDGLRWLTDMLWVKTNSFQYIVQRLRIPWKVVQSSRNEQGEKSVHRISFERLTP